MKYYRKRNIHHPLILVGGKPVDWKRVQVSSGVIETNDPETIKVLDAAVAASKGAVTELEAAEYQAITAEKKTPVNRTSPPQRASKIDQGRSGRSPVRSPKPSVESAKAPDAVAPKVKQPRKAIASAPVVEPPPGVDGVVEPE